MGMMRSLRRTKAKAVCKAMGMRRVCSHDQNHKSHFSVYWREYANQDVKPEGRRRK